MTSRTLIRIASSAIIAIGALALSRDVDAQCVGMACNTVYCASDAQCDSPSWLAGYCAGKDCPSSLPGCVSDFGTCGLSGQESIRCNEVNQS
jgi:hypothetical protein